MDSQTAIEVAAIVDVLPGLVELRNSLAGTVFLESSSFISHAWNFAIIVAAVIFITLLFISGTQYLTAAGNEDQAKKARMMMLDATVGFILVIAAWPVGLWAIQRFGLSNIADPTTNQPVVDTSRAVPNPTSTPAAPTTPATPPVAGGGAEVAEREVRAVIPGGGAGHSVVAESADGSGDRVSGVTVADGVDGVLIFTAKPGPYRAFVDSKFVGNRVIQPSDDVTPWTLDLLDPIEVTMYLEDNQSFKPIYGFSFHAWAYVDEGDLARRELINTYTTELNGKVRMQLPSGGSVNFTSTDSPDINLLESNYDVPTHDGEEIHQLIHINTTGTITHSFAVTRDGQPVEEGVLVRIEANDEAGRTSYLKTEKTDEKGKVAIHYMKPGRQIFAIVGETVCPAVVPNGNAEETECPLES